MYFKNPTGLCYNIIIMIEQSKLIVTDSYFNVFELLTDELKDKVNSFDNENFIFCEEKVSLMTERILCEKYVGTFNTKVYSFGKFLKANKKLEGVLSKEGSSMAVRKILSSLTLKRFFKNSNTLSKDLFDLIIQLKSANVKPKDVLYLLNNVEGLLKYKLEDIYNVYINYEKFLKDNNYLDQSDILTLLPEIIINSEKIKNANVYIIGYTSFTRQIENVIKALFKTARSVTAILPNGFNRFLFLGETEKNYLKIADELNIKVDRIFIKSPYIKEAKILKDNLYSSKCYKKEKQETDIITLTEAEDVRKEVETVAETIKSLIIHKKCRYNNVNIALGNLDDYKNDIKEVFDLLDIPYFLDEKKKAIFHPLTNLIISYAECFKHNFERKYLISFIINPFFNGDKSFNDLFINYLTKYGIFNNKIKKELVYEKEANENFSAFENTRKTLVKIFESFNVRKLLQALSVQEKIEEYSLKLKELNDLVECAVNSEIYDKIIGVLDEIDKILTNGYSVKEFLEVFKSGINALELSIIPQNLDAVFIGDYKQIALCKSDYLFFLGLDENIPAFQKDLSVLSDNEIDKLASLKVLIEPKISVVNARLREAVGLSLCVFNKRLFLSYPIIGKDNKKRSCSDIISQADCLFNIKSYNYSNGYLTFKQGKNTFALDVSNFAEGRINGLDTASSFYYVNEKENEKILKEANKEITVKLKGEKINLDVTSPTTIEEFYKCPYKNFLSHILKLKDNDDGSVYANYVGNIVHEIFKIFLSDIKDKENLNNEQIFSFIDKAVKKVMENEEYSRFMDDGDKKRIICRSLKEAETYCKKFYLDYSNSSFRPLYLEKKFGDGEDLGAIELLNGKVKLKGIIDRVDYYKDYFRIIDYKTGGVDVDDANLFAGVKIQLYLYALALKTDNIAGLYYLHVDDSFNGYGKEKECLLKGKTLDDKDLIKAQDKKIFEDGISKTFSVKIKGDFFNGVDSKEDLKNKIDYSKKISENAVKEIFDGVIVPSPFEKTCDYCPYVGICDKPLESRKIDKICDETFCLDKKGENDG